QGPAARPDRRLHGVEVRRTVTVQRQRPSGPLLCRAEHHRALAALYQQIDLVDALPFADRHAALGLDAPRLQLLIQVVERDIVGAVEVVDLRRGDEALPRRLDEGDAPPANTHDRRDLALERAKLQ